MRRAAAVRRIRVYALAALGALFTGMVVGCTEVAEVLEIFEPLIPDPDPNVPRILPGVTFFQIGRGETLTLDLSDYFTDPNGDPLEYGATASRQGIVSVSVSDSAATVVGVGYGTTDVIVTARDPGGLEARQSLRFTVRSRPPEAVGSIPEQTVDVGDTVSVDVSPYFSDPDGDALAYEAVVFRGDRASVSMSGSLMSIVGLSAGSTSITVAARDPAGTEARQFTSVTVIQPNRPPEITDEIPDQTVDVGDTVWFNVFPYFDDPDGDRLTYSAASADESIATVETPRSTVRITGVAAGSTTVTVTARDPDGLEASQEVGVTVNSADSR